MRLTLLTLSSLIALLMAVVQHYALLYSWYWTYPFLDSAMHFSGGALITLIAVAFLGVRVRTVAIMFVVAVLWEVFEFVIGVSVAEPNFVSDTLTDLVFDILGGGVAYGIMHLWQRYTFPLTAARAASPDQTSSLR